MLSTIILVTKFAKLRPSFLRYGVYVILFYHNNIMPGNASKTKNRILVNMQGLPSSFHCVCLRATIYSATSIIRTTFFWNLVYLDAGKYIIMHAQKA